MGSIGFDRQMCCWFDEIDRFDNGSMRFYFLCNISRVRGLDGFDMSSIWDR